MPSSSRAGFDASAIASVIQEWVLGWWKRGVAFGSDGGGDVVVGGEEGVGHGGWGEGRAEDEMDDGAAVLVNSFWGVGFLDGTG